MVERVSRRGNHGGGGGGLSKVARGWGEKGRRGMLNIWAGRGIGLELGNRVIIVRRRVGDVMRRGEGRNEYFIDEVRGGGGRGVVCVNIWVEWGEVGNGAERSWWWMGRGSGIGEREEGKREEGGKRGRGRGSEGEE